MTGRYVKCNLCNKSFCTRYVKRHECKPLNQTERGDLEDNFGDADDYENQPENKKCKVDMENSSDNETETEDVFDDLFQEAFFLQSDTNSDNDENVLNDKKHKILLKWICLFIAHWQYVFNITDNAIELLLKFFSAFFRVMGSLSDNPLSSQIHNDFPVTLYSFHRFLSIEKSFCTNYVVCSKCCTLYLQENCTVKYRGEEESAKCTFVKFPHHNIKHFRKKCGNALMKTVISPNGKKVFVPYKTYCYRSVKKSLQDLVKRTGFEKDCENWRTLERHPDILTDVYDGEIWNSFHPNGTWYFSQERNYAVMLNVDWFQPFKHLSSYSIGGIYLVILNLTRNVRFQRKNVILVGIIPNMNKEPPTNKFMQPLVNELKTVWEHGFNLYSKLHDETKTFRIALLCVGCDIPAARKLCGFLGHSAVHGCSKCNKTFPGRIGERNYGGFDINQWNKRTTEQHREQMTEILRCNSAQNQEKLESLYGTRYSVLAELPYFDTVRMTIVDPMHNLFLGTAKKILTIWKELGYLNKAALEKLQEKTDQFVIPSDIGKIPRKIVSSFDGFNADEYKNWTILFSLYASKNVIPSRHLECFRKFVIACQYLCRRVVSKRDIIVAHQLLHQFCLSFEQLYGENRVTPNIHLHMHLKDCIYDYGPIYSFWLFSFERYNGLLGSLPNNKKNIESQVMKRFCRDNSILNLEMPNQFEEGFRLILEKLNHSIDQRGSLGDIATANLLNFAKMSSRFTDPANQLWHENSHILELRKSEIDTFSFFEMSCLQKTYKHMYPEMDFTKVVVSPSYLKTSELCVAGDVFGSSASRNHRSSYIVAYWSSHSGNIKKFTDEMDLSPRPGVIRYFLKNSLVIDENNLEHWFAYCEWFSPIEEENKNYYGKPLELWHQNLYEQQGAASFIPVSRILAKFVHVNLRRFNEDLILVVPRIKHSCF